MEDLNDLALFAAVVTHGGFSGAARALGIPKSRLSRRVAELEERVAVRLLQRSTRSVSVTEVGSSDAAISCWSPPRPSWPRMAPSRSRRT